MNIKKMASIACLASIAICSSHLFAKGPYTMRVNVHYEGRRLGNPIEISVERSETIGAIKEKLASQAQERYSQVGHTIDSNPGLIALFIGNKELTDHNMALRHLLRSSGPLVEAENVLTGSDGQEIYIQLRHRRHAHPATQQEEISQKEIGHKGRKYQPTRKQ